MTAIRQWRDHLPALGLTVVMTILVAAPLLLRARSVAELERQYRATQLGQPEEEVRRRLPLRVQAGAPPERYRNDVWRRTAGDRRRCRAWGVTHGTFLGAGHSLIIGFDGQRRVTFKALGNT